MKNRDRLFVLLLHITCAESDLTPLTKIFRSNGSGGQPTSVLKRQYRLSTLKAHPEKVPDDLKEEAKEATNVLTREWEQVQDLSLIEDWISKD